MLGQNNTGGSCFTFASSVNANNQLDSPYQYDAGGYTYNWDAESQLTSALSNLGGQFYVYDGDGKRVSDGHLYWYGPHGELLGLTDGSGNLYSEYIYLGSRLIAQVSSSSAAIYIPDSLGSSRVVTNQSGVVYYGADFTPFGGERAYHTSWSPLFKFEGKQRDNYTSNDDFGARYYSNRWGRWLSADWSNVPVAVPYANLTNPQTLNLYSMVADDPESFADLDGHNATWASLATFMATGCGGSDTTTFCVAEAEDIANNTESQGTVTGQAQNTTANTQVGNTTSDALAKTMTNEVGSLSTPKKGDPDVLVDAKTALANALINNANLDNPAKVAPATGTASTQDAQIMKDAVANRAKGGADPVEGRTQFGTTHNPNIKSRSAGNHLKGAAGRETVYEKFGPFKDSTSRRPTFIVIYNDPGQ